MRRIAAVSVVALAAVVTAADVLCALTSDQGSIGGRVAAAVLYGLVVGVPTSIGAVVLIGDPGNRFARALYLSGLVWSVVGLVSASNVVLYSTGRVAYWFVLLTVAFLLLAFPSGRLTGHAERMTVAAAGALATLLYLPTALLVHSFPTPFPGVPCNEDCPHNAFAVTSTTPGFISVVRPVREVLSALAFMAVLLILLRRMRGAAPLLRRALGPVTVVAGGWVVAYVAYLLLRATAPNGPVLPVVGYIYGMALPLIALSFGVGLLARKARGVLAMQRLARRLSKEPTTDDLQHALADSLGDPELAILHWRDGEPGQWLDAAGWPAPAPTRGPRHGVAELRLHGRLLGAIVHDVEQDATVVRTAASFAVMALQHAELVQRLRRSLGELTESRARIVTVADETRRQIERDLHDGAQQRLVALRLQLAAESSRLQHTDPGTSAGLAALGDRAEQAIDDIRSLAQGIYPALLAERGLPAALSAVASAASIRTTVSADGIGRFRPEIESAVYFACVEALQNAAKHADGARSISIALAADEELSFAVRDDGPGTDATVNGNGAFTTIRDRIRAVGGEVAVESPPDHGTRLVGTVPLA